ncbi:MAG: heparinase II/III family protein [Gammaproteobacteria bacterium]|nr:heparinase II/III family protein [Gammaproteobacteria bacterium]
MLAKIRRGLRKPPKVIFKRLKQEVSSQAERYFAPRRAHSFTLASLLKQTQHQDLETLWSHIGERAYCTLTTLIDLATLENCVPNETTVIFERANRAMAHKVNLLGSGLIELGTPINWHKDYKSQYDWPPNYILDIDYNNPGRPSDVKFPWEVSRMQWLIPVGQAYLLTQDETYAESVKAILIDWIRENPYAQSINWACTMEVAIRILTWTWLFHVFKSSQAWNDNAFRQQFLTALYLHADFTERHLEYSDINGNHYTANAAGLVFAGLFFGQGDAPDRWQRMGWHILCCEFPRQICSDGVDFEASVPYHRLVLELFFLPARYRQVLNLEIPENYSAYLCSMAQFTAAYTQPSGNAPVWGDADDARALPFGYQAVNDHRYICALVGYAFKNQTLLQHTDTSSEFFWVYGNHKTPTLHTTIPRLSSISFPEGGFYIMRNQSDHIFIDCGPVGLAGRGGHGHNDCLSFEAVLNGVKLISDCGAYVYTASYEERNQFRATASHNTPCIDNQEINRFIRWDYLWTLHNDAKPTIETWHVGDDYDCFIGSHSGYHRLADPVTPRRTIQLNHANHHLIIQDEILCEGQHVISIPLHLDPNVKATISSEGHTVSLEASSQKYKLVWESSEPWQLIVETTRISPSYGVLIPSKKLIWQANIIGNSQLKVTIIPHTG